MGLKPRIHIDKMLKHFSIKPPRSDSCRSHMERVLAKTQCLKTLMSEIHDGDSTHFRVWINHVFHGMYNNQICPILQSCCEYRYQSDQSTDHGTTVKNVIEYWSSTDDMFSRKQRL